MTSISRRLLWLQSCDFKGSNRSNPATLCARALPWFGRITRSSAGQPVDHSHFIVFVYNSTQLGQRFRSSSSTKSTSSSTRPSCFRLQPPSLFFMPAHPTPDQTASQSEEPARPSRPSVRPRPSASVSRLLVGKVEGPRGRFLGRTERSGQKISAEYDSPPSLPPSISRASDPTSNWGNKCTEWKHAA